MGSDDAIGEVFERYRACDRQRTSALLQTKAQSIAKPPASDTPTQQASNDAESDPPTSEASE